MADTKGFNELDSMFNLKRVKKLTDKKDELEKKNGKVIPMEAEAIADKAMDTLDQARNGQQKEDDDHVRPEEHSM